jgi:hypothetical protein
MDGLGRGLARRIQQLEASSLRFAHRAVKKKFISLPALIRQVGTVEPEHGQPARRILYESPH